MADWDVVSHDPIAGGSDAGWNVVAHAPAPSVAGDVAKSAGIGLVKGGLGLAGMPGDLATLGGREADFVTGKLGLDPSGIPATLARRAASGLAAMPFGPSGFMGGAPTSQGLQSAVEGVTSKFPEPQTTAGKYAQTVGEFAPAAIGGPESLATRLATRALIPGLASEAAGQATEGTAAEPYARIGAAALGGLGAARAAAPTAPKLAINDVLQAGSDAYKSPEVMAVQIKPQAAQRISTNITDSLNRARLNDRLAPQTHAIIDDLATPVSGPDIGPKFHTLEDFQTTRQLLGKVAGNFANPTEQAAASQAIKALDQHLSFMPQSDLFAGDIAKANDTLTAGRADYAAGKAAERVQDKLNAAEIQNSRANSRGNLDNATRQRLSAFLTSAKGARGLTPEELDQIDQVVSGSTVGNALSGAGKVLGGGGGLGMLHSSGIGAAAGGAIGGPIGAVIGGVAAPALGYGLRSMGDAITRARANALVQQILSRSPSAASLMPPMPATSGTPASLLPALMGSTALRQQIALPQLQQR